MIDARLESQTAFPRILVARNESEANKSCDGATAKRLFHQYSRISHRPAALSAERETPIDPPPRAEPAGVPYLGRNLVDLVKPGDDLWTAAKRPFEIAFKLCDFSLIIRLFGWEQPVGERFIRPDFKNSARPNARAGIV